ncbi:2-dehydro-3-deoxyglucarate aldolase [Halobacteriales archaeon QH_10_67_22]|nr:MAG: 2-dehydro-3-deoxyglucarate aldolase [Halobacteriales archaeon QH_10_67_22]
MPVTNDTLQKLENGDVAVGAWLLSGSSRAAEVLSRTAVDWVGIDTEHAPNSPEHVETSISAVETEATPLVRLPSVEAAVIGGTKRALDSGAQGVIVPGIETASEAKRVVRTAQFPPAGERGVAGTVRANAYGEDFGEYVTDANDETLVVIQLESRAAVERADEILGVDGIDVVFIGENDLSAAFGYPGETDRSEVKAAVERIFDAAQDNDIYPGIAGRTPAVMAERAERGFQFFLLGADLTFIRAGVEAFLAE